MKKLIELSQLPGFDTAIRFLLLSFCIAALTAIGIVAMIKHYNLEAVAAIITVLINLVMLIANHNWGSSAGSKDKDETIKNILNKGQS